MKNESVIPAEHKAYGLMEILKTRFENNISRHSSVAWDLVQAKLEANPNKLKTLAEMEASGGEPDVVLFDKNANEYVFYDCSSETPKGRRNLCYDMAALESRKNNKPQGSAKDTAARMGIEMLNEEEYRFLQSLGEFDAKTSSWIDTPDSIRKLGGALFCDRRYNHVFVYHNGAESYYSVRGFRGKLKL